VFEGKGVVLECGVPIRLREMSRVAGLWKEGEIGQPETSDDLRILSERRVLGLCAQERMDQEQAQHDEFRRYSE